MKNTIRKHNSGHEVFEETQFRRNESFDIYAKPKEDQKAYFFKIHPIKPFERVNVPFSPDKVFTRKDNSQRYWLTYSESNHALYCTVCLTYSKSSETNVFIEGMNDWRHLSENQ